MNAEQGPGTRELQARIPDSRLAPIGGFSLSNRRQTSGKNMRDNAYSQARDSIPGLLRGPVPYRFGLLSAGAGSAASETVGQTTSSPTP